VFCTGHWTPKPSSEVWYIVKCLLTQLFKTWKWYMSNSRKQVINYVDTVLSRSRILRRVWVYDALPLKRCAPSETAYTVAWFQKLSFFINKVESNCTAFQIVMLYLFFIWCRPFYSMVYMVMPSLVLMSSSHYITGVFALFVEPFICCLITLTVHSLTTGKYTTVTYLLWLAVLIKQIQQNDMEHDFGI